MIPAAYTNRCDWWLSSVTLRLGDKDIWMLLVTKVSLVLTWLGLDLSVSVLGLETQAESDLRKRSRSLP